MGFNKVYKSLQEIFPQVDARALRAVAIEHSKDADAAVEAVLVEIIPFFTERSRPSSPSSVKSDSRDSSSSSPAVAAESGNPSKKPLGSEVENSHQNGGSKFYFTFGKGESSTVGFNLDDKIHENSTKVSADVHTQTEPVVLIDKNGVNDLQIGTSGVVQTVEISADKQPESSTVKIPCETLETPDDVHIDNDQQTNIIPEKEDCDSHIETDSDTVNDQENYQGNSCPDGNTSAASPASFSIPDQTDSASENIGQFVAPKPLEESLSADAASVIETTGNNVINDDDSSLKPLLSQSSQIHMIDVLHELIEDARNHKRTLSEAKESVISLMKEVELKELAAKDVEEEAAKGDSNIWVKVEELKQMLQHAKGANDMHSGDVYGEKAVLATELKELQTRVLSMADERDKYLAVLDKMHQNMEERLSAAEKKIANADLEKHEREKSAKQALAEQELIMDEVVQESNILKQQAEENAKLREFLVDRGRVVDVLQGEISVVCQDIRLLKEKYDENVPFSNSLFSSHSSGFLGSSHSSLKSMSHDPLDLSSSGTPSVRSLIEDQVEPVFDQAEIQKKKEDPIAGFRIRVSEEEAGDDRKALIEDGWDFFDNREIEA